MARSRTNRGKRGEHRHGQQLTWIHRDLSFPNAMEHASGRSLERFFERWIFSSAIPTVRFTTTTDEAGRELHVRFEQKGDVFDIPITVTLIYADGKSEDVVVAVTEQTIERSLPLKGVLRSVEVNRDGGALAEITR